jgi:hypothetical protein
MSSQADIQEKIAAARREAEGLKEKIRSKRDATADTSRTFPLSLLCSFESTSMGVRLQLETRKAARCKVTHLLSGREGEDAALVIASKRALEAPSSRAQTQASSAFSSSGEGQVHYTLSNRDP